MKPATRQRLVGRIRKLLERRSFPRLQMMFLVALTGGAGFLSSYLLLQYGVAEIWVRYLTAVAIAYVVFLVLLWLWLRTSAEDYQDVDGVDALDLLDCVGKRSPSYHGGGGRFGGGGASGRYDDASLALEKDTGVLDAIDGVDGVDSADEFAIPIVILLFVLGVLLASFTIVWSAPTFFAELVLDGVLAATLYRHLKKLETRHWLETAIRHTFVPFAITALVLVAVGLFIATQFPDARTLGDAIAAVRS